MDLWSENATSYFLFLNVAAIFKRPRIPPWLPVDQRWLQEQGLSMAQKFIEKASELLGTFISQIPGLFLGFQVLISHGRWMGEGDPWLGILMGAWLGWPHVGIALYLTYVLGGLGIGLLWLLGIVKRGTRIPFAPLLALGTLGVLIFGETLEGWARLLLV